MKMEFEVQFKYQGSYSVEFHNVEIGLNRINEVRANLNLPNLTMEVFLSKSTDLYANPGIQISEITARRCNHFEERNVLQVFVNRPGFLNSFVVLSPEITRNDDGKIEMIKFISKVNKEAILEAWEEAGFPLKWGFEE